MGISKTTVGGELACGKQPIEHCEDWTASQLEGLKQLAAALETLIAALECRVASESEEAKLIQVCCPEPERQSYGSGGHLDSAC